MTRQRSHSTSSYWQYRIWCKRRFPTAHSRARRAHSKGCSKQQKLSEKMVVQWFQILEQWQRFPIWMVTSQIAFSVHHWSKSIPFSIPSGVFTFNHVLSDLNSWFPLHLSTLTQIPCTPRCCLDPWCSWVSFLPANPPQRCCRRSQSYQWSRSSCLQDWGVP